MLLFFIKCWEITNLTTFERIKKITKKRGYNLKQVAKMSGMKSENAIYRYNQGVTPRDSTLKTIAQVLGTSFEYLKGETDDESPHTPSNIEPINNSDLINIPLIGTIKAGINGIAFEEQLGMEFTLASDIDMSFEHFWLVVRGDSMIGDGISDGDYALIKKTTEFNKNDICAVIVDGEEGTLKHVTQNEDSIVLTASNPIYPPRVFTGTDMNKILIAGKLVQIKRNY